MPTTTHAIATHLGIVPPAHVPAGTVALVDGPSGATTTYPQLDDQAAATAGWLAAAGIGHGDRVVLWLPNLPVVAPLVLGAWRRGAVVVPLSPMDPPGAVAGALADAAAVVTIPPLAEAAAAHAAGPVICLGEVPGTTPLAQVLTASPAPPLAVDPSAVAVRLRSSGTSGLPKQVALSHANLSAGARQAVDGVGMEGPQVALALAPFCHVMGLITGLVMPLATGWTVVVMPRFEPEAFLGLLAQHRVTTTSIPPTLAAMLAFHPAVAGVDLSALRFLAVGGAPLPPAVHTALAARLPGCAIGQGYGMTETAGMISVGRAGVGSPPGTAGWLVPDTEARLVDPATGVDVPAGRPGELRVRGPQVMQGYVDDPAATEAAVDADGWLRTGDQATLGADGLVTITGRLKDLLKVNGLQVSPAEVEQVLAGHPAVADAAVIGIPDERAGERPVCLVVPRPGADVIAEDLLTWLAPQLAPHARPVAVHFVAALPRTPSGKLLRRELTHPVGGG